MNALFYLVLGLLTIYHSQLGFFNTQLAQFYALSFYLVCQQPKSPGIMAFFTLFFFFLEMPTIKELLIVHLEPSLLLFTKITTTLTITQMPIGSRLTWFWGHL